MRTFTEAEIRASVVFQLSKLCSLLLKGLRDVIGGGGWDALVSGSAVGTLVSVDRIEPGALTSAAKGGPLILLVKEASGDEEVKAASEEVKGVVLCQVRDRWTKKRYLKSLKISHVTAKSWVGVPQYLTSYQEAILAPSSGFVSAQTASIKRIAFA